MKVVKIILQLGLFIIVITVAFVLVTSKTDKLSGIRSFIVLTGSMQPTISQNSIIFTKKQSTYSKNDIIAFKQGNVTITHRIIKVQNNKFKTKGDANNSVDDYLLSQNNILGKEIAVIPYVGHFTAFLRTPLGFTGLIIIPALIFIIIESISIKKEMEKEIEKKFAQQLKP